MTRSGVMRSARMAYSRMLCASLTWLLRINPSIAPLIVYRFGFAEGFRAISWRDSTPCRICPLANKAWILVVQRNVSGTTPDSIILFQSSMKNLMSRALLQPIRRAFQVCIVGLTPDWSMSFQTFVAASMLFTEAKARIKRLYWWPLREGAPRTPSSYRDLIWAKSRRLTAVLMSSLSARRCVKKLVFSRVVAERTIVSENLESNPFEARTSRS